MTKMEISVPCPICAESVSFTMVESIEWSFPEGLIPRVSLSMRSVEGFGADAEKPPHWRGPCGESFAVKQDDVAPQRRCPSCLHSSTMHNQESGCMAEDRDDPDAFCDCMLKTTLMVVWPKPDGILHNG